MTFELISVPAHIKSLYVSFFFIYIAACHAYLPLPSNDDGFFTPHTKRTKI